jgi:hypothetical protein
MIRKSTNETKTQNIHTRDKIEDHPRGDEGRKDDQRDRSALRSSPNQVSVWKGEMIANASSAFDRGKRISDQAEQNARKEGKLYKKIGELSMDVEFLKKSCRKLGIELPAEYDD